MPPYKAGMYMQALMAFPDVYSPLYRTYSGSGVILPIAFVGDGAKWYEGYRHRESPLFDYSGLEGLAASIAFRANGLPSLPQSFYCRPDYFTHVEWREFDTEDALVASSHCIIRHGEVVERVDDLSYLKWDAATWTVPFCYAPKFLCREDSMYRLSFRDAKRLRRPNLELKWFDGLSYTGVIESDAVLYDPVERQMFRHYHTGCWGDSGIDIYSNVKELERRLETINADSIVESFPDGLIHVDELRTDGEVPGEWATGRLRRHAGLGLSIPRSIIIVGLGGVGFHVALQAAMVGVKDMCLLDFDEIGEENRNRLYAPPREVGQLKTVVARRLIEILVPNSVGLIDEYARLANHHGCAKEHDAIIDCTDNILAQIETHAYAVSRGIRYIRAGYDGGFHVTVTSHRAPEWGDLRAGYAVPAWIAGAQIAASLALVKLVSEPNMEFSGDIRRLRDG